MSFWHNRKELLWGLDEPSIGEVLKDEPRLLRQGERHNEQLLSYAVRHLKDFLDVLLARDTTPQQRSLIAQFFERASVCPIGCSCNGAVPAALSENSVLARLLSCLREKDPAPHLVRCAIRVVMAALRARPDEVLLFLLHIGREANAAVPSAHSSPSSRSSHECSMEEVEVADHKSAESDDRSVVSAHSPRADHTELNGTTASPVWPHSPDGRGLVALVASHVQAESELVMAFLRLVVEIAEDAHAARRESGTRVLQMLAEQDLVPVLVSRLSTCGSEFSDLVGAIAARSPHAPRPERFIGPYDPLSSPPPRGSYRAPLVTPASPLLGPLQDSTTVAAVLHSIDSPMHGPEIAPPDMSLALMVRLLRLFCIVSGPPPHSDTVADLPPFLQEVHARLPAIATLLREGAPFPAPPPATPMPPHEDSAEPDERTPGVEEGTDEETAQDEATEGSAGDDTEAVASERSSAAGEAASAEDVIAITPFEGGENFSPAAPELLVHISEAEFADMLPRKGGVTTARLGAVQFFAGIVELGSRALNASLAELRIPEVCLGLMRRFERASVLHAEVSRVIQGILAGGDEKMLRNLCTDSHLPEFIVRACDDNINAQACGRGRLSYMGHVYSFGNLLESQAFMSPAIANALEKCERWSDFTRGHLGPANAKVVWPAELLQRETVAVAAGIDGGEALPAPPPAAPASPPVAPYVRSALLAALAGDGDDAAELERGLATLAAEMEKGRQAIARRLDFSAGGETANATDSDAEESDDEGRKADANESSDAESDADSDSGDPERARGAFSSDASSDDGLGEHNSSGVVVPPLADGEVAHVLAEEGKASLMRDEGDLFLANAEREARGQLVVHGAESAALDEGALMASVFGEDAPAPSSPKSPVEMPTRDGIVIVNLGDNRDVEIRPNALTGVHEVWLAGPEATKEIQPHNKRRESGLRVPMPEGYNHHAHRREPPSPQPAEPAGSSASPPGSQQRVQTVEEEWLARKQRERAAMVANGMSPARPFASEGASAGPQPQPSPPPSPLDPVEGETWIARKRRERAAAIAAAPAHIRNISAGTFHNVRAPPSPTDRPASPPRAPNPPTSPSVSAVEQEWLARKRRERESQKAQQLAPLATPKRDEPPSPSSHGHSSHTSSHPSPSAPHSAASPGRPTTPGSARGVTTDVYGMGYMGAVYPGGYAYVGGGGQFGSYYIPQQQPLANEMLSEEEWRRKKAQAEAQQRAQASGSGRQQQQPPVSPGQHRQGVVMAHARPGEGAPRPTRSSPLRNPRLRPTSSSSASRPHVTTTSAGGSARRPESGGSGSGGNGWTLHSATSSPIASPIGDRSVDMSSVMDVAGEDGTVTRVATAAVLGPVKAVAQEPRVEQRRAMTLGEINGRHFVPSPKAQSVVIHEKENEENVLHDDVSALPPALTVQWTEPVKEARTGSPVRAGSGIRLMRRPLPAPTHLPSPFSPEKPETLDAAMRPRMLDYSSPVPSHTMSFLTCDTSFEESDSPAPGASVVEWLSREIPEDKVSLVMEQAGCSRRQAVSALRQRHGSVVDALVALHSPRRTLGTTFERYAAAPLVVGFVAEQANCSAAAAERVLRECHGDVVRALLVLQHSL